MNMIDAQDKLKSLSEQHLVSEMQSPSGAAPATTLYKTSEPTRV